MNEDKIRTNEDLTEEEWRLADLLFEMKDDEDFVNMIMSMADEDGIITETADFLEDNPECTESDLIGFIASFTEMVWED